MCCIPWDCKELDMTEQLNKNMQIEIKRKVEVAILTSDKIDLKTVNKKQ